MFSKILVPIDGSKPSEAAIELALRIASENRAEVVFVHAVELNKVVAMTGPGGIDPGLAIDAACKAGSAILDDARACAQKAHVQASFEQPEDECVSSVLQLARQRNADLIVIGSHGRSGIPRAFLGSVAEGILRRSHIPVLVCHAAPAEHPDKHTSYVRKEEREIQRTIV